MQPIRTALLLAPIAGLTAVAVAGCGSSGKAVTPGSSVPNSTSSPATVTDTVQPPPTTATQTVVTGPPKCASSNVALSLASNGAGAGSTYYFLRLTNKGSASCTLTGYPGVSFVAPGNGATVGAAAVRTGSTGATVTLAPGAVASAQVQVASYANFDPGTCKATAVSGFRVYVPDNTAASYVPFPGGSTQACSGDLSSTGSNQLTVQSVVAGSGTG